MNWLVIIIITIDEEDQGGATNASEPTQEDTLAEDIDFDEEEDDDDLDNFIVDENGEVLNRSRQRLKNKKNRAGAGSGVARVTNRQLREARDIFGDMSEFMDNLDYAEREEDEEEEEEREREREEGLLDDVLGEEGEPRRERRSRREDGGEGMEEEDLELDRQEGYELPSR